MWPLWPSSIPKSLPLGKNALPVKNIHSSLIAGGDVRISNLGVFDTAARAEREGRNPATGATIKIAASKAVRFRVSKPLKDAVNG